jgi:DNA-binding MarR family transcriptional regulator
MWPGQRPLRAAASPSQIEFGANAASAGAMENDESDAPRCDGPAEVNHGDRHVDGEVPGREVARGDELRREVEIADGLLWCAHRLFTELAHALEFDMSPMQWLAVRALRERDMDLRTLSALLGCTRSSVSELVGRLERDGLARRLGGARDGRTRVVTLTDNGAFYAAGAEAGGREVADAILQYVGEQDRDALHRLVRLVIGGLTSYRYARVWSRPPTEPLASPLPPASSPPPSRAPVSAPPGAPARAVARRVAVRSPARAGCRR